MSDLQIVELKEYVPAYLEDLSEEAQRHLHQHYRKNIKVTAPSLSNGRRWEVCQLGWAGYIPLLPELHLRLLPKIPNARLWEMLAYAYDLKSFRFLEGVAVGDLLERGIERLAAHLAERVLVLCQQGLSRAYRPYEDRLPYLRGRLVLHELMRRAWEPRLPSTFEEQTSDTTDNQILTWTLHRIGRLGILHSEAAQFLVQTAYRKMLAATSLVPHTAPDCEGRLYDRLTKRYRPLHALCRFFLENSGPTNRSGGHETLPFLVNLGRLYERCVQVWLARNLPSDFKCRAQQTVELGGAEMAPAKADIVISDRATRTHLCVLDTKWKIPTQPSPNDIYQVRYYAATLQCGRAVLVYPRDLAKPLDTAVSGIRIQTLTFSVDDELDQCGPRFLNQLQLHRC